MQRNDAIRIIYVRRRDLRARYSFVFKFDKLIRMPRITMSYYLLGKRKTT